MHEMRRADRQVTDEAYIDSIIQACDCLRLGFVQEDEAYIVPLNFGYEKEEGRRVFYIHSASEGRKISLIKGGGRVSFEMDRGHGLRNGDTACRYGYNYQSIMGKGQASMIEVASEKEKALEIIMKHYSGKSGWTFDGEMVSKTAVIKIVVTELTCKECKL